MKRSSRTVSDRGKTPFDIFMMLRGPKDGSILLEFEGKAFIGLFPQERSHFHSFEELRSFLSSIKGKRSTAGFISYDAVRYLEKIPDRHFSQQNAFPDLFFLSFTIEIFFDISHATMTIFGDEELVEEVIACIRASRNHSSFEKGSFVLETSFSVDCDDAHFCEKVKKAKEFIVKGDAFQIVLSRTFHKRISVSAAAVYAELRKTQAPFLCLLETEAFSIASASPERLVSLKNRCAETMPIAGTRPRKSGDEDLKMQQELLSDEKELAEHMMLVDLGRNDLGKVCKPQSVQVKELKQLHLYSHVMHLVSRVKGELKEEYGALDLIRAVFPAGTLSGAPKIRAMQIIDELESSRRGLYGGAICLIDHDGNLESSIAIRTMVLKNGIATIRTGAGIVFDSDPEKETEETRHKAKGLMAAIECAEGACT
jgi:anthranilate synthase component I